MGNAGCCPTKYTVNDRPLKSRQESVVARGGVEGDYMKKEHEFSRHNPVGSQEIYANADEKSKSVDVTEDQVNSFFANGNTATEEHELVPSSIKVKTHTEGHGNPAYEKDEEDRPVALIDAQAGYALSPYHIASDEVQLDLRLRKLSEEENNEELPAADDAVQANSTQKETTENSVELHEIHEENTDEHLDAFQIESTDDVSHIPTSIEQHVSNVHKIVVDDYDGVIHPPERNVGVPAAQANAESTAVLFSNVENDSHSSPSVEKVPVLAADVEVLPHVATTVEDSPEPLKEVSHESVIAEEVSHESILLEVSSADAHVTETSSTIMDNHKANVESEVVETDKPNELETDIIKIDAQSGSLVKNHTHFIKNKSYTSDNSGSKDNKLTSEENKYRKDSVSSSSESESDFENVSEIKVTRKVSFDVPETDNKSGDASESTIQTNGASHSSNREVEEVEFSLTTINEAELPNKPPVFSPGVPNEDHMACLSEISEITMEMETIEENLASGIGKDEYEEDKGLEEILETLLRLSQLQDELDTKKEALPLEVKKTYVDAAVQYEVETSDEGISVEMSAEGLQQQHTKAFGLFRMEGCFAEWDETVDKYFKDAKSKISAVQELETLDLHTAQHLFERQAEFSEKDAKDVLTEHRRQVLELRQKQKREKERLKQKLQEKLAERKQKETVQAEASSIAAEDVHVQEEVPKKKLIKPLAENGDLDELESLSSSDDDELLQKYGELMNARSEDSESEYSSSFEEDSSSVTSSSSESYGEELGMQETITLKNTLTVDIKDHLDRMTPIDFQALMELYRKERDGLKTIKEGEKTRLNQSLWQKLAERKQKLIDQGIEEGQEEQDVDGSVQTKKITTEVATGTDTHTVEHVTESGTPEEQKQMADAETQMGDTFKVETLRNMDSRFVNAVLEVMKIQDSDNRKEKFEKLLREHLDHVDEFQRLRDADRVKHSQKLQEKLKKRKEKTEENSSDSESDNELETVPVDEETEKSLEELKTNYHVEISARCEELGEEDLQNLLKQYREDQEALLHRKGVEKNRLDDKLQQKLADRKNRGAGVDEEEEPFQNMDNLERYKRKMEHETQEEMKQMDEDFFKELHGLREAGNVEDDNLDKMLEEHLDKVDDFKKRKEREARAFQKKIERELAIRRQEREEGREEHKKLRDQERLQEQFDARAVDVLVQEHQEQAIQAKQIRNREKELMDEKLKQKLARRKQKSKGVGDERKQSRKKRPKSASKSRQSSNNQTYELAGDLV